MKSNEWYTPAKYIEAAREVMGRIDLDPASCYEANLTVRAGCYYDKTSNGLMQPWHGCVWLNPPFAGHGLGWWGGGAMPSWIRRLLHDYEAGHIEQAVLLCMALTQEHWFQTVLAYPVCFPHTRIHFFRPGRSPERLRDGVCFVYLGPHESRFIDIFSRFGTVARRVSAPKPTPIMLELF